MKQMVSALNALAGRNTTWVVNLLVAFFASACTGGNEPTSVNSVPTPAAIAVVSGDLQTGVVNKALSAPVVARVTTSAGASMAGASVQFAVTTGAATVTPSAVTTDSAGVASTAVMLGGATGAITVLATVTGTTLSATFRFSAITADADSTAAPTVYNPDWTEATHGKASPNYTVAFPQDGINTIEISLTAAQWASVRTNMTALWGFDFGLRTGGAGGFPAADPDYVAVPVKYNGKVWKKVGWRLKGNSTLSSAWGTGNYKLPFRLKINEFEDAFPAIKGQRFYGFKEISFSPGRSDNSLIREKVTADLFRLAGVPAARTAMYRVFIDFGVGLRYVGVYAAVEVIDDSMVKDQFGDDKGNIYKPESNFRTFVETQFEKKNNKTSSFTDVQAAVTALNSTLRTTDPAQWRTNLEAVFNVDHFLRWLAVDNAIVNWDSYGTIAHNYYLFNDPVKKLTWIPWDHNEAMIGSPGATGGGGGTPGPGNRGLSLQMNEISNNWPLIRLLADDPVYFARYKALLKSFNETVFTTTATTAMFDKYHAMIAPYVIGPTGEQLGATYITNPAMFTNALQELKNHVANRKLIVSLFSP